MGIKGMHELTKRRKDIALRVTLSLEHIRFPDEYKSEPEADAHRHNSQSRSQPSADESESEIRTGHPAALQSCAARFVRAVADLKQVVISWYSFVFKYAQICLSVLRPICICLFTVYFLLGRIKNTFIHVCLTPVMRLSDGFPSVGEKGEASCAQSSKDNFRVLKHWVVRSRCCYCWCYTLSS